MPAVAVLAGGIAGARAEQPFCDMPPTEFNRLISAIDSLLAHDEPQEAARRARDLLGRHPDCPLHTWQIQQRYGLALHATGRDAEALSYLESAVRQAPAMAANHLDLAATLMALGRKGRALSEYQEAVRLEPGSWRAHLDYGQALQFFGLDHDSREQLLQAAQLCDHCPQAARALARLYLAQEDYAAAVPALKRVWSSQPDPDIRHNLALAYLRSGQPDAARALLAAQWPAGLDHQDLLLLLEADRAVGDPGRAASLVDSLQAGRAQDADPRLWSLVGLILLDAGLDQKALAAIDRAVALDPSDTINRTNRAATLARLQRLAEAVAERDTIEQLEAARQDTLR